MGAQGEPPFENSWDSFGLNINQAPVSFYKDRDGIVHLRGEVENGTLPCIFQLPVGYRPPFGLGFAEVSQGASGITAVRVNVGGDGSVCLTNGFQNVIDTLEGIEFRTDS